MSKKDSNKKMEAESVEETDSAATEDQKPEVIEYSVDKITPLSSAETLKPVALEKEDVLSLAATPATTEKAAGDELPEIVDPVFRELSEPKLPELPRENRARLLMQSPTRIQFYWSIKENPFQTLKRAFGGNIGSYTLVAKLVNQKSDREEIFPVEDEGSWWFDVDADAAYRAEIGFYAPNRPFVRIMFSNTLETPRKNPSPRRATEADWAVTANEFAEVLDSTGYTQDAFEVAMAGDDLEYADRATHQAFSQFIGEADGAGGSSVEDITAEEIRFALLALVSGFSLADLRGHIGATLFAILKDNTEKLAVENAFSALSEHFDISMEEIEDEQTIGEAVFGLSLIHFPRVSKKRRTSAKTILPRGFRPEWTGAPGEKLSPVSSLSSKISPVSSF